MTATPIPLPAARVNLAEQVYATLKAQIHDFQLVAGDRFSEADLGSRLGVSRTPVREALFRLRSEGFLDVEPKLGWFVKPIDFGKLEQLYDLRIVLELASVLRLCTRSEDPPELDALKASGSCRWPSACLTRDRSVRTERIRIIRRLDFTRPDRIEATYTEHAKILRAVIQRKADQAQLLLKAHVEQSKAEVRKITLHTLQEARARLAR
jgi:DNA-binding GntR family transcriptional regulator